VKRNSVKENETWRKIVISLKKIPFICAENEGNIELYSMEINRKHVAFTY
jgi:hypothetical protein